MSHQSRPSRAILNFAHRCAMNCSWCYVPFANLPAQKAVVMAAVARIAELGFTSITFGGGDPFQYSFIDDVVYFAKSSGLFVHVDTHGKGLVHSHENVVLLESAIDLVGLPLDGSTAVVHDAMRSSPGHFELILKRMQWIKKVNTKVKLNTVITSQNSHDLEQLARLVTELQPSRWSIYQYWPIGPGMRVAQSHGISDEDFSNAGTFVTDQFLKHQTVVEVNGREARRDTYPIIHHDGAVMVHATRPDNNYVTLGTIFDQDILSKILQCCGEERPSATNRYTTIKVAPRS